MTLHIGMVAGEPSGDLLAGRIISGCRHRDPDFVCSGIGGPHMQSQGFETFHNMNALSVFGYVDA
ncbi:MAG: lipid-A-disaccharide synthase, partial [Comamonadaceae bacterium]